MTTLIVVAAAALACWFVFAWATGATLITFRTGSMAPTMPQGTLAVSMPVQASEIAPGDVVTVHRPSDGEPVTHRVVEVRGPLEATSAQPLAEQQRELILQGDANDRVDGRPYVVAEAREVTFAMPGVGAALRMLQSPMGMGVLVLGAGALTVWAFWPKSRKAATEGQGQAATAATATTTDPGPATATASETVSEPAPTQVRT